MDAFFLQILNGLDKGSAYALIALGLTLIFGTLGVVNFAHGALFMIGAFCAVTLQRILSLSFETVDPTQTDFLGNPLKVHFEDAGQWFLHVRAVDKAGNWSHAAHHPYLVSPQGGG